MALQDLTPELRTRMSRVERLVGLFVLLSVVLMLVGFGYYLYNTGVRRHWFEHRVPYYCYTKDATGLKVGDPVRMLGRDIGRILEVSPMPVDPWFRENNRYFVLKFEVWSPNFGYIFTDSKVRLLSSDFFGSRHVEVTPGDPNVGKITVATKVGGPWDETTILNDNEKDTNQYVLLKNTTNGVWIPHTEETPAMAARVDQIVQTVALALPVMTNQVGLVLMESVAAVSNANRAILEMQPMLAEMQTLTRRLNAEDGVIGRMMLTSNLHSQVEGTLLSMQGTLTNTTALLQTSEVQLQDLTRRMALTLDHVSGATSNLTAQVNANSLFLGEVSSLVVNADDLLQGLKRHWLLRSAFGPSTNVVLESVVVPSLDVSPR